MVLTDAAYNCVWAAAAVSRVLWEISGSAPDVSDVCASVESAVASLRARLQRV